jgi:hypothetical protein
MSTQGSRIAKIEKDHTSRRDQLLLRAGSFRRRDVGANQWSQRRGSVITNALRSGRLNRIAAEAPQSVCTRTNVDAKKSSRIVTRAERGRQRRVGSDEQRKNLRPEQKDGDDSKTTRSAKRIMIGRVRTVSVSRSVTTIRGSHTTPRSFRGGLNSAIIRLIVLALGPDRALWALTSLHLRR